MESLKELTDEKLVKLYASNNNEAFDILLDRYKSRVFAYILGIVKDRDEANDFFQETFFKAIVTIRQGRYTDTGKFAQWIIRIAHNLIIDGYRKDKNDSTMYQDEIGIEEINDLQLYDDGLEEYWRKETMMNDIVELIGSLPENQQTIVRLRFFKDLSFKEIADIEAISINTALGRMRYALINLKKLAEEKKVGIEY